MTLENYLFLLIISLSIFLIFREVFTWYWKINKQVQLQEETNRLLKELIEKSTKKVESKTININDNLDKTSLNNPEVMEELLRKLNKPE